MCPDHRNEINDIDFYEENGRIVLTKEFLERRGYCCNNGCRHCPYKYTERETNSENSSTDTTKK